MQENYLTPGRAGKLRGKLFFVSGHFTAKHGRPHLRALAERQYTTNTNYTLGRHIRRSLLAWLRILHSTSGTRQFIGSSEPSPSDVIIFTDGFYPDARPWLPSDTNPPRVGWVAFLQEQAFGHDEVLYSSRVLTTPEIDCWIPRINQIAMVELMAAVVVVDHLGPRIRKRYVVLFDRLGGSSRATAKRRTYQTSSLYFGTSCCPLTSISTYARSPLTPIQATGRAGAILMSWRVGERSGSTRTHRTLSFAPWFGGPRLRNWPESTHQASGLEWTVSNDCDIDGTVSSAHHLFNFIEFFKSLPLPSP